MKKAKKGIYCLEVGEWFGSLKRRDSIEPILALLQQSPLKVPYIHRDIATVVELKFYLRKWLQRRLGDFPILYLGFHGRSGCIQLASESGKPEDFETDDLFQMLAGKCRRRIVHFGACSVLNIHGNKINHYLKESKAAAISGYAADVAWVDSSVFELLYLSELQGNEFTTPGLRAVRNRVMKVASKLSSSLKFEIKLKK